MFQCYLKELLTVPRRVSSEIPSKNSSGIPAGIYFRKFLQLLLQKLVNVYVFIRTFLKDFFPGVPLAKFSRNSSKIFFQRFLQESLQRFSQILGDFFRNCVGIPFGFPLRKSDLFSPGTVSEIIRGIYPEFPLEITLCIQGNPQAYVWKFV